MNTHNGIIYIGVTDDGEVIGIDNVDETLKFISNIIVDSINPSCKEFVKPMAVLEEGKLIVKVEVSKGTALYYIKSNGLSESGCFIRVGTSCRGLNDAEIKERFE
ncbi:MAG: ATP-binding protein, partial [Bacilli bacterium]|nr:ATP-binding protein [Bacilli bacterium]